MGCSTSTTSVGEAAKCGTAKSTPSGKKGSNTADKATMNTEEEPMSETKYPASEAFIIPLDNNAEIESYNAQAAADAATVTSLVTPSVSKKLPKRIQQLMEQQQAAEQNYTLETIEDKLQQAEQRRKEFLQQKIENVQKTTLMLTTAAKCVDNGADGSETYANEIKSKALDDDSKRELLTSTKKN